jgi:hypothetical protein
MDVWDTLAAIDADATLSDEEKKRARYAAKASAIADIINNGKPAPNPVPAAIGNTYRLDGVDYTIFFAAQEERNGTPVLRIIMLAKRVADGATLVSPRDDMIFVNPDIYGSGRKKDLVEAARDRLRDIVRRALADG